jgi:gamma-glutamyltranspeptidase/glutathione hydrolase
MFSSFQSLFAERCKPHFVRLLFVFSLFLSINGVAQQRYDTNLARVSPVVARQGMVSTENFLATQIGLEILKRGGNAVDAAVAVGFALAVVLPDAGNIGGGGFMMVYSAKHNETIALDFREVAPLLASKSMFLDANGKPVPGLSTASPIAIGVPGTVAGFELALKKYGTMRLEDLMTPAIRLAENGFIVTPYLETLLETAEPTLSKWESTKAIFFRNGRPLKAGERLVQKDLGRSLRLIARGGSKAFYQGSIARKIVADIRKHGGLISQKDFDEYRVVERTPVVGTYRGCKVVSMPPPSSGGVHLIQMLNVMENFSSETLAEDSAKRVHLLAETMKFAYADRAQFLGDPDFVKIPQKWIMSKEYAKEMSQLIDQDRALPANFIKSGKPIPYESDETTHYTVVDKSGNIVSTTYTLNLLFGSGMVASGTGILLNNEMDDFATGPGIPNSFGLVGGLQNLIEPRKRPLSSMSPTIVFKNDRPFLVTGSPGGSRIITTVLQIITNVIDRGMNVAEATLAPRMHHQWNPDTLRLESGFSLETKDKLKSLGHQLYTGKTMGRTQTMLFNGDRIEGFSDTRNPDGLVLGY